MSLGGFEVFPNEVILIIFGKIDNFADFINLSYTNSPINSICRDDTIWKIKYQKDFWKIDRDQSTSNERRSISSRGRSNVKPLPLVGQETWKERYLLTRQILKASPQISVGFRQQGFIDESGKLTINGKGDGGQIETEDPDVKSFVETLFSKVISVACSDSNTTIVTEAGKVYYWGNNRDNYLGFRKETLVEKEGKMTSPIPQEIRLPGRALKVVSGRGSIGVILEDFSIYVWGVLRCVNEKEVLSPPTRVNLRAIDLSMENVSFTAVGTDNQVYFWGEAFEASGYNHTKGPTFKYIEKPALVTFPSRELKFKQVSMGDFYIMALSVTGKVYIWGHDRGIQPTLLPFPTPITYIDAKENKGSAIDRIGKLYIWGDEYGTSKPRNINVKAKVKWISIGEMFFMVMMVDGTIKIYNDSEWP